MNLLNRLLGWLMRLPPAVTRDIVVEEDIPVPMADGVTLLGDRYYPRGNKSCPTVLVRSPYGRAGLVARLFAFPFAERGFQVFIQSCRGTFGSGGQFDPLRPERADGLATVAWLRRQPWFNGQLAMTGPSYLGFVQWALAGEDTPELQAIVPAETQSDLAAHWYPNGSFNLETAASWGQAMSTQENRGLGDRLRALAGAGRRRVEQGYAHLPVREVDRVISDRPISFWQDLVNHVDPYGEHWAPADHRSRVAQVRAPVHLVTGWYDLFLPGQLRDYRVLRDTGRAPYLTIGPWHHRSPKLIAAAIRESVAWFQAFLLDDRRGLRQQPVSLYVMGADAWRHYDVWPPDGYQAESWHLHAGGKLAPEPPEGTEPSRYRYDPADPTPAVGGIQLSGPAGPKDNRQLEARADVLVFSSAPLDQDVEVIGPVSARLYVQSSLEHTDFFVRLCDVAPSGKSINLSDGLQRLTPGDPAPDADDCLRVEIDLWPTAYRFRRGHRIRVQVSSGAHPRYMRHPGTSEPLATATTLRSAEQRLFHDPEHPSAIRLPVKHLA